MNPSYYSKNTGSIEHDKYCKGSACVSKPMPHQNTLCRHVYLRMGRCLFLSHTWRQDALNRDTHARVANLASALESIGWEVWLDDNEMYGDIDVCMARGIDRSVAVIFCLTRAYFKRVDDNKLFTNCKKEWTYAHHCNKPSIPIVMEPSLLDIFQWPRGSSVTMRFANTLYVDASHDDMVLVAREMTRQLSRYGITPQNRRFLRRGGCIRSRARRNIHEIVRL